MAMSAEEIYTRHIKNLPTAVRLRLLEITARDLASTSDMSEKKRSLLELEGLGAQIWQGIDAQSYVSELRQEWDHRP